MPPPLKNLSSPWNAHIRDRVLWRTSRRLATHALPAWIIFAGVAPTHAAGSGELQFLMDSYNNTNEQNWTHRTGRMDQSTLARDACVSFPSSPFEI